MDFSIYAAVIEFREKFIVGYSIKGFREVDNSKIHLRPVIPEFIQVLKSCYQLECVAL